MTSFVLSTPDGDRNNPSLALRAEQKIPRDQLNQNQRNSMIGQQ